MKPVAINVKGPNNAKERCGGVVCVYSCGVF